MCNSHSGPHEVSAMPVCVRCSSALLRDPAGGREYISPVIGSRTRQCTASVGTFRKESMYAAARSGTRGLLDLLVPADRRAVEPVAVGEPLLGELLDGDREVLHEAGKVAEAQVDGLRTEGRPSPTSGRPAVLP
jgi:hypothetical protein